MAKYKIKHTSIEGLPIKGIEGEIALNERKLEEAMKRTKNISEKFPERTITLTENAGRHITYLEYRAGNHTLILN